MSVTNITQILPKSTPTPTLNNNMSNYYHVLNENIDLDDDDDKTVITSNRSMKKDSDCATVATEDLTEDDLSSDEGANLATEKPHQKQREYAILDSGATAHFIVKGADVINLHPSNNPLRIKLPDGTYITSTHTCNLNIPWLPNSMTEAHIVPRGTHDDGGRPTVVSDKAQATNNHSLLFSRKMEMVVSGGGKGEVNSSCMSQRR